MRADKFLAEKFGSRSKASDAITRGLVLKNGKPLKVSDEVSETDELFFVTADESFVSNGGFKLSRAIKAFSPKIEGLVFADLGASTGGFTDCLLQNGAKKVYCVDVGESQLDKRIACDDRVVVMDNTNARYLNENSFSEKIDAVVSDLSFISLKLILPSIANILTTGGYAITLIKPQFECGRDKLGKNGIVAKQHHADVISSVYDCATGLGLAPISITNAPIRPKKNVEYVALFIKGGSPTFKNIFIANASKIFEMTEVQDENRSLLS